MEVPANRSRLDARLVARLIIEQFPGLDVGDVRRFAVGWDHELFAVDVIGADAGQSPEPTNGYG